MADKGKNMNVINKIDLFFNEQETYPGRVFDPKTYKLTDMDKKMLAKGKNYKIFLPPKRGEPLYTDSFNSAKEMAKEYGKGVLVADLSKVK